MKKFFAAALIAGNLFFGTTADAQIKTYTATGEEISTEFESEEVMKLRARDKAIKLATEQAGVDFKNNFGNVLSDDEISAIIVNGFEFGSVNYTNADKIWHSTIEIKIDDAEVKNFLRRDDRERFILINQTLEQKKIFAANDKRVEKLRERAANVKKREEKKFFKAEFEYVNNEFLSNQRIATGNKFFYRGRIDDAIKVYTEAITPVTLKLALLSVCGFSALDELAVHRKLNDSFCHIVLASAGTLARKLGSLGNASAAHTVAVFLIDNRLTATPHRIVSPSALLTGVSCDFTLMLGHVLTTRICGRNFEFRLFGTSASAHRRFNLVKRRTYSVVDVVPVLRILRVELVHVELFLGSQFGFIAVLNDVSGKHLIAKAVKISLKILVDVVSMPEFREVRKNAVSGCNATANVHFAICMTFNHVHAGVVVLRFAFIRLHCDVLLFQFQ